MDDTTSAIITIFTIIFGVLSIILFFKVWGACNNIKRIREHLCKDEKPIDPDLISEEDAERMYIEQVFKK